MAIVRLCKTFRELEPTHVEQALSSLAEFAFSTYRMAASFENVYSSFDVFCDVLITVGMTYTLMSNRTHVRRTNDVLNTLAIYAINCGSLHLVFAITSLILVPFHFFAPPSQTFDSPSRTKFARFPNTLIYTTPSFVMVRLSLCAFMAILNSRDHLRETLDRPDGVVVVSLTQTSGRGPQPGAPACETPPSKETPSRAAVPKCLPPVSVSLDTPFGEDCVIPFDRDEFY
ncbi:hypothetical protein EDB85DRAFT_2228348 [Lactarius pseudohatsudake]|nr:hypothetical protein EDB85DRAFT_2228348 [Lactarius pseudohatsudake]